MEDGTSIFHKRTSIREMCFYIIWQISELNVCLMSCIPVDSLESFVMFNIDWQFRWVEKIIKELQSIPLGIVRLRGPSSMLTTSHLLQLGRIKAKKNLAKVFSDSDFCCPEGSCSWFTGEVWIMEASRQHKSFTNVFMEH